VYHLLLTCHAYVAARIKFCPFECFLPYVLYIAIYVREEERNAIILGV